MEDSSEQLPRDGTKREEDAAVAGDESLEAASRDEREVARGGLREELGREPSDEDIDEWLRRHTEGY